MHNNDLAKAEHWLREQAQSLGWSKATKLEGRATKQGLVGVLVQHNIGAMLEVNCETDFVARNVNFQQFVQSATLACCQHAAQLPTNDALSKIDFDAEYLKNIDGDGGKTLNDQLALIIGKVGENASLRRATCFKVTNGVSLASFAHPAAKVADSGDAETKPPAAAERVQLGRFGALVALNRTAAASASQTATDATDDTIVIEEADLRRNLCQHIVGMNPTRIGVRDVDKPAEVKDDESCLIWQEYLLGPSMTVQEILEENGLEVVDFKRFECGETVATAETLAATKAEEPTVSAAAA